MRPATAETWIELVCRFDATRVEAACDRLVGLGIEQWWIDQPVTHARVADGWATRPALDEMVELHVYLHDPAEAKRIEDHLADLADSSRIAGVQPQDWLTGWREGREVVLLPDNWCIAPPWLAESVPDPARAVIIDPGLAFGAGDHPTTRDSAVLVLELVRPGDRVLDLGAGSGVLSLLARKAGAQAVLAVEIDPMAAAEIPRNAALNGIDGIEVVEGSAEDLVVDQPYDLVLMNIGAREATRLVQRVGAAAAPGASVVISGLAEWAAPEVAGVFIDEGWRTRRRRQVASDWVTLAMCRESSRL